MKIRQYNRITEEVGHHTCAHNLCRSMERILQYQSEAGEWHDVQDESQPFTAYLVERKEKSPGGKTVYLNNHSPNFHYGKAVFTWTDLPEYAMTFATKEIAEIMMEHYKKTSWDVWPESEVHDHIFNCGTFP